MNLDDCIVERKQKKKNSYVKSKEYTQRYLKELYDDDITEFHADSMLLGNMISETKIAKSGKEYESNLCVLNLFNDESQTKVPVFIQNFDRYKDDMLTEFLTLRKQDHNVLYDIIVLKEHSNSLVTDSYTVNFESFRKYVNSLENIDFKLYQYTIKNFDNVGLHVVN